MATVHVYIDESGAFQGNSIRSGGVGGWVVRDVTPEDLERRVRRELSAWADEVRRDQAAGQTGSGSEEPAWLADCHETKSNGQRRLSDKMLHYCELLVPERRNPEYFPDIPLGPAQLLAGRIVGMAGGLAAAVFQARGVKNYYTGPQDLYVWNLRCAIYGLLRADPALFGEGDRVEVVVAWRSKFLPVMMEYGPDAQKFYGQVHDALCTSLDEEFSPVFKQRGAVLGVRFLKCQECTGLILADMLLGALRYPDLLPAGARLRVRTLDFQARDHLRELMAGSSMEARFDAALKGHGPEHDLLLLEELLLAEPCQLAPARIREFLPRLSEPAFHMLCAHLVDAMRRLYDQRYGQAEAFARFCRNLLHILPEDAEGLGRNLPLQPWREALRALSHLDVHGASDSLEAFARYERFLEGRGAVLFRSPVERWLAGLEDFLVLVQRQFNQLDFHAVEPRLKHSRERYEQVSALVAQSSPGGDELLAKLVGTVAQAWCFIGDLDQDAEVIRLGADELVRDIGLCRPGSTAWSQGMNYLVTARWLLRDRAGALAALGAITGRDPLAPSDLAGISSHGSSLFPDAFVRDAHAYAWLNQLRLLALEELEQPGALLCAQALDRLTDQSLAIASAGTTGRYPLFLILKWALWLLRRHGRAIPAEASKAIAASTPDNPLLRLLYVPLHHLNGDREALVKELDFIDGMAAANRGWAVLVKSRQGVLSALRRGDAIADWEVMRVAPYYYG